MVTACCITDLYHQYAEYGYQARGKHPLANDVFSTKLHFFYDAQSCPAFVAYNGVKYCYAHSLQGDIVGIVDSDGNLVVEYRCEAWGETDFDHRINGGYVGC